jgi:hypothetical protein
VFFLRFALLTCAIYLAITIALELAAFAVTYWKGGLFIGFSVRLYGAVFAVVWLISFSVAWRIFMHGARANFARWR